MEERTLQEYIADTTGLPTVPRKAPVALRTDATEEDFEVRRIDHSNPLEDEVMLVKKVREFYKDTRIGLGVNGCVSLIGTGRLTKIINITTHRNYAEVTAMTF